MTTSRVRAGQEADRDGEAEGSAARRARSLERMSVTLMVAVAAAFAFAIAWSLSDVLLVLFAAILLACQLRFLAGLISRYAHLPYSLALTAVVLLLAGAAGGGFWWHGPRLMSEFASVWHQIQVEITGFWQRFGEDSWPKDILGRVETYLHRKGGNLAGDAAGIVTSTMGNFGSVLLIVVTAIYLAAAPEVYIDGLVRLLPPGWRSRGRAVMDEEGRVLRRWFVGQVIDMAVIGTLTAAGLWALGVPLWLTLGLFAGLANFVPYIGALVGSVPALAVALGQSPTTAIYVLVLVFAIQSFEGYVVAPIISKRTVHVPPVLTLLSQTVLGTLFGPFGLILATPLTAATLVIVKMVYVETVLGGPPRLESAEGGG